MKEEIGLEEAPNPIEAQLSRKELEPEALVLLQAKDPDKPPKQMHQRKIQMRILAKIAAKRSLAWTNFPPT